MIETFVEVKEVKMTKTKKVSKLELEILELESKLAPSGSVSSGKGIVSGGGGDLSGNGGNAKLGAACYDEFCIPRPEGAEC